MFRKFPILVSLALLFTIFAGLSAAQNFSFQLTPIAPPIIIPPEGASFSYIIAATNNESTPQQATVWCTMTLPDGSVTAPVLGPITITFGPGQTLSRTRTQVIPPGAPAGTWTFHGFVGVYGGTIYATDGFTFDVLTQIAPTWVARYNYAPWNGVDAASAIVTDGSGNVIVTGTSGGDYATIKYNGSMSTGDPPIWVARYDGGGADGATSIAVDGNDDVFVTGKSCLSPGAPFDYLTLKYSGSMSTGDPPIWVAPRYNGTSNRAGYATYLAVDGNNDVIVTGANTLSSGFPSNYDYATIKYSGVDGHAMWTNLPDGAAIHDGTAQSYDIARAIAVDGNNDVFVTGSSTNNGTGIDYVTIKYDGASGLINNLPIWEKTYSTLGLNNDIAYALALDAVGDVYVTGKSASSTYSYDYATIKYRGVNGDPLWLFPDGVVRYDGGSSDEAYAIAVNGGFVYVTGASRGIGTLEDYATLKYDGALGLINNLPIWAARYNYAFFNGSDEAHSIGVDGGGNVYVTGWSQASAWGLSPGDDYATVMYNSAGVEQGSDRYIGEGTFYYHDRANALALDAAGNVYITGESDGDGTGLDYATIKYAHAHLDNWMPVEATVLGQPLPQENRLESNYPNPFNPTTAISYQLAANSRVSLKVYDMAGRLVETLVDGWREAGTHELTFDASSLPSGMYVYRIQAGEWTDSGKMVLLK